MFNIVSLSILILCTGIAASVHFGEDPAVLIKLLVVLCVSKLLLRFLIVCIGMDLDASDEYTKAFVYKYPKTYISMAVYILLAHAIDLVLIVQGMLSRQPVVQVTLIAYVTRWALMKQPTNKPKNKHLEDLTKQEK
jgi:hypothetical protein